MNDLISVSSKNVGLGLDVGVVAFEEHGEARIILELDIVLSLHHAVETRIVRSERC